MSCKCWFCARRRRYGHLGFGELDPSKIYSGPFPQSPRLGPDPNETDLAPYQRIAIRRFLIGAVQLELMLRNPNAFG